MQRIRRGFSLVELMIVLAVLAILAGVAYPAWREAVMSSRRSDAVATLLRLQLLQEKWRAGDADYATLAELGWAGGDSLEGYYRIRLLRRSAAGFLATAEPRAGGPQVGDRCGRFALNQDGPVLSAGYADARCWRR